MLAIASPGTADTIYINGKIYTVDDSQEWAQAVAIKDRKFVAVGLNPGLDHRKLRLTKRLAVLTENF